MHPELTNFRTFVSYYKCCAHSLRSGFTVLVYYHCVTSLRLLCNVMLKSNARKVDLVDVNSLFRRCYLRSCQSNCKHVQWWCNVHYHKKIGEIYMLQNNLTRLMFFHLDSSLIPLAYITLASIYLQTYTRLVT